MLPFEFTLPPSVNNFPAIQKGIPQPSHSLDQFDVVAFEGISPSLGIIEKPHLSIA
jgi:hypothetical protein